MPLPKAPAKKADRVETSALAQTLKPSKRSSPAPVAKVLPLKPAVAATDSAPVGLMQRSLPALETKPRPKARPPRKRSAP